MRCFVLMGVAGCGKTSVGEAVAEATGATFIDGDILHPKANIDKMSRGHPLSDEDRWPWLTTVGRTLRQTEGKTLIGCSALKKSYRDAICTAAQEPVCFVHLAGSRALITERMAARTGHFMPVSLIDSQFSALEPPGDDECSVAINIALPIDQVIDAAIACVQTLTKSSP